MSTKRLSQAARAAGFAMATSEELLTSAPQQKDVSTTIDTWQSAEFRHTFTSDTARTPFPLRRSLYALLGWNAAA